MSLPPLALRSVIRAKNINVQIVKLADVPPGTKPHTVKLVLNAFDTPSTLNDVEFVFDCVEDIASFLAGVSAMLAGCMREESSPIHRLQS